MPLAPKVTWRTVEFGESAQERVATYGKARAEVARKLRRDSELDFML